MTVKPTVSLTDHAHSFARSLVESGRFASLSAVIQHGLTLVEREEQEHQARLDAIRADRERQSQDPPVTMEEMEARVAEWRARRNDGTG